MVAPELIKAAQAGDQEALVTLLRAVEHHVYRTAYYILGSEQDALDASQEALLRIYSKIGTYEEKAQFKTWVQRIVTNICIDKCRKKRPGVSIDDSELVLVASDRVEDEALAGFVADEIRQAIARLPEHHRTVVVLRYLEDFSYNEIAEALNLPLNTVKSYLFRARRQLQAMLQDYRKGGVRG